MLSVEGLLAGPHGQGATPYQKPLKVVVVAVAPTHNYTKDGQEKTVTEIGLADSTGAIKGLCWDKTKLTVLKQENVLMFRNYIVRDRLLVITSTTKVSKSNGTIEIPDEFKTAARNLVVQSTAPVLAISAAKMVPVGQLTSISGKVVREEGIVQRQTIKGDALVRSVFLKDKTGEARVSLWNDISSTETPVSSYIEIVNVKVGNINKGQVTFNSTARTEIKEIQEPAEEKETVIDGYYEEQSDIILVCKCGEDYIDFVVTEDILRDAVCLEAEDLKQTLEALNLLLPLPVRLSFNEANGKKYTKSIVLL